MAEQPSTTLVSEAEIQAALFEATTEVIPSLDDGTGEQIIPVPVPAPAFRPLPDRDPAPGSAGDSATDSDRSAAASADSSGTPPQSGRVGRLLYWSVDAALWVVNRPFGWLPPGARRLTGAVAIVTLAISLLAPYVLPLLCPPHRH
jgi:hypothetical protein